MMLWIATIAGVALSAAWTISGSETCLAAERNPPTAVFAPPCGLDSALDHIPRDARALMVVDARLHRWIAADLSAYAQAAAARRGFAIAVLPILGLDDYRPPEIRSAIASWRAARARLEGLLLVGNVKLPSFFMPRADIPSTRLWPRYYEDLDMHAQRRISPGAILKECGPGQSWPCVAGRKELKVPEHDFDDLAQGASEGPEIWVSLLPVGYRDDAKNTYEDWAKQVAPFFRKALAFYRRTTSYGRGLYLVSNDLGCLARSRPVWDAVGPQKIEFYSINEKGPDAFVNNPAGYLRAKLENYGSLDDLLAYANKLPGMGEGWQSAEVFLTHMKQSRRRFVWWNVHSDPEHSLISRDQAWRMQNGGLIAVLNGCSVAGFRQPGSLSHVDVQTAVEDNVLLSLVYGSSAFVAAVGSPHDRVNDEHAAPLFAHMYAKGYLGMAHLLRLRHQDKDSPDSHTLRGRQEMLVGDPFVDVQ